MCVYTASASKLVSSLCTFVMLAVTYHLEQFTLQAGSSSRHACAFLVTHGSVKSSG